MATYNIFDIFAEKVEVGECLEVVWEGEAPFLFEVVSRFSDQIYGQTYHGGCFRGDPFQLQPSIQPTAVARPLCSREKQTNMS